MNHTIRRRTRGVLLTLITMLCVVLGVSLAAPAQAGHIVCGNGAVHFYNNTAGNNQIHLTGYGAPGPIQGCQQYSDILTIKNDSVFLDTAGAYLILSPRVACDIWVGNGITNTKYTWKNTTYGTTYYEQVGGVNHSTFYQVDLCNAF